MRFGIYSGNLASNLPYALDIERAARATNTPIALLYAIAWQESIQGEVDGSWVAATVVSPDGGRGLCQLTSSFPDNWEDPTENATYACTKFILPAAQFWTNPTYGFSGEVLVKCIAATYNAGIAGSLAGHDNGNVDMYTTNGNYGESVLGFYRNIVAKAVPT